MKWVLTVAGVVLLALGVVWALQGAGIAGGSVMTGQKQWLVIGVVLVVVGIGVLAAGLTRVVTRRR